MDDTNAPRPPAILPDFTPVPRKKDRSNGWKPEVQRAFIEALADTGSVKAACARVNRSTHGAYHLRRQPGAEEFAAAWEAAQDHGMDRMEDIAMDRAVNGVEVPVYSYGKLVGTRTVYNDRLMMFMLRNRRPERFAEGSAKGPDAVDKMELTRLKKEWRKEWEREQGARQLQQEVATIASINAKIDKIRAKEEAAARLEEEHRARREAGGPTDEERRAAEAEAHREAVQRVWEQCSEAEEEEEEAGPKVRSLKDDGWR